MRTELDRDHHEHCLLSHAGGVAAAPRHRIFFTRANPFLLGVDYGRWLFFWVASSMILHVAGRRAPAFAEAGVGWLFTQPRIAELLRRFPAREWYLLVFGVPVCWNLRNFLAASPAGRHLEIILSWL